MMIKELSAKSGVNRGTISNYLKKDSAIPSVDVAVKLAKVLKVSVNYLVTGEETISEDKLGPYLIVIENDLN